MQRELVIGVGVASPANVQLFGHGAKMTDWICIYTAPGKENLVNRAISALGYRTLWCHYVTTVTHARKQRQALKSYFSRYLFAQIAPGQPISPIATTMGVTEVLGNSDGPHTVPEEIIERLKSSCDANGLINTEETAPARVHYPIGATIRVIEGPASGYYGRIILDDRRHKFLKVTVEYLGRQMDLTLPPTAVQPVAHPDGGTVLK